MCGGSHNFWNPELEVEWKLESPALDRATNKRERRAKEGRNTKYEVSEEELARQFEES